LPSSRSADSLAVLALVVGAVAIAFAPIFVRIADTGPVSTAFWRQALSLPLLWGWLLRAERDESLPTRTLSLLIGAGLFFAGDIGVWHISLRLTSIANSTFLINMAPLFVTLGGWLLLKERVSGTFLAGMALALGGALLLSRGHFAPSSATVTGDVLALVAAVSYAGYLLSVKYLRGTCSTATIMAWSSMSSAVVLLPAMLLSGERMIPESVAGWWILLGLAVIPHVAGQSLIAWAMAHLPASFSSVALLVQPVSATALAWVLFGEPLAALQAAGATAVLAGVMLARRGSREASR
jgi:drug/metabolite transporter (DMT)-like permease